MEKDLKGIVIFLIGILGFTGFKFLLKIRELIGFSLKRMKMILD
jgi:hypothetical protein